jgi:hypothetical protein
VPLEEFDYGDAAIALKTLARLQSGPARASALDALWQETKERALFLYPRVCCVCNAPAVRTALAELRRSIEGTPGFVSTADTPEPSVADDLGRLLSWLGIERIDPPRKVEALRDMHKGLGHTDSIWDVHVIRADMRRSRLAGTGRGGRELTSLEDAIRRFTALLAAADLLAPAARDDRVYHARFWFGRDELDAAARYVDDCLAVDA